MIRWIPYVFVRIVLFFIAGILLGIYFPGFLPARLALATCIALLFTYGVCVYFQRKIGKIPVTGLIGLSLVFIAGYTNILLHTDSTNPNHILNGKPFNFYEAIITKPPEQKEKTWRMEATIQAVKEGEEWHKTKGNLLIYLARKDSISPCRYGDLVVVRGMPQVVPPPANPGEFDYKRFLSFKNIYHQHFIKSEEVIVQSHRPPSVIMLYACQTRAWCEGKLKKYVHGVREQSIASALVLGLNNTLDNELQSAYSGTGTLHVLSVSGLHVSIIYLIILFLFKPFQELKGGKLLLALVSVSILWAYAFITGLSPSVLRAVMMFSFVAIARPWNQRTNIYNTLAISAFLLLLYDPYLVMSVGFQLSYLAVLGIVYIQPGLYNLWEPKTKIWDEIWKVSTVSVTAQAATFSLGLLYFHQFPNYFLISNLLVIPESFGVLIAGLAVVAFSFADPVANFFGMLLEFIIKVMNGTVLTIEAFPFSVINGIYINSFQCMLLAGSVLMTILSLRNKQIKYAGLSALLLIVFSIVQWINFDQRINTQKIAVYSVQGHFAMDLIDKRRAYFFADNALLDDIKKIDFHISPNRIFHGVTTVLNGDMQIFKRNFNGCDLTRWKGKNILHITDTAFKFPKTLCIDYCIVANNAVADLEAVRRKLNFKKLVLDASNSRYFSDKIVQQAKKLNIDTHSVLHQGAFVVSL